MTLKPHHYAALSALCVLLLGACSAAGNIADHNGDMWHYYTVSGLLLRGEWPYRDFPLEYPPFALLPMLVPRLLLYSFPVGYAGYVWGFLVQNALLTWVLTQTMLALSARISGPRRQRTAFFLLLGLLIFCPTLPWRYDVFPALLTAFALQALFSRRLFLAGIWLGLGTVAKLYPLFLLPLFVLYLWEQNQRRGGLRLLLGCAAAVVICLLPFAALPPPALLSFLKYHEMRGLEFETIPAGIILLAHRAGLVSASLIYNYGAMHLVSPAAPPVIRCLPAVFATLYGGILWQARRVFKQEQNPSNKAQPETLVVFLIAILLAFILANKVFSPQYLIWLLPFAPLLRLRPALLVTALFCLTAVLYPFWFQKLCEQRTIAILLLNLRNALALVILGILVFQSSEYRLPILEEKEQENRHKFSQG